MSKSQVSKKRKNISAKEYDKKLISQVVDVLGGNNQSASKVISGAITGQETENDFDSIDDWIKNQLIPNAVSINQEGYTQMCIDALKTTSVQVLTDFGNSRQRDFGQAWADMIRGYLGELAVKQYFEKNFQLKTQLAHQRGKPASFYDTDIAKVYANNSWREPKINIGIKTTKFNGVWLDIAKEQFSKSHIHIQVKIGGGTTHLFSFFKELSIFKDKILKVGLEGNYLTQSEADQIWHDIPKFSPIPAYIAGFAKRDIKYKDLDYKGNLAKLHFTIHSFQGLLPKNYITQIKKIENVSNAGQVKFASIGKFSGSERYLFNTGSIHRSRTEWKDIVQQI